jgi:hypothetical protein
MGRTVHFLSGLTLTTIVAGLVATSIAAGGCSHAGPAVGSTQPFRDERDPADGFQYYESAVPADDDDKSESEEETATETTIEIDVDDESAGAASEATPSEGESDDGVSDPTDGDSDDGSDVGSEEPDGESAAPRPR